MGLSLPLYADAVLTLCVNTALPKKLTPMGLVASESAKCFADFIDEIGYFGMYLEWRYGCFWARLGRYYMISGGESAVPHSKFIRSGGRVKHIKTSP